MAEMNVGSGMGECVEVVRGLYLEGLAIDPARDLVWYSDVIAGGVHAVRPDGTPAFTLNPDRKWTGGILLNHDGAVLSSGGGGIMWNRPEEGTSGWLVSEVEGVALMGVNEMTPDGHGGIYFGSVDIARIEKGEPPRPASLYHLGVDRKARLVAGPLGFTNGIMRSPDGAQLFYNDTFDATYAFDIQRDGGLGPRRKLLDKEDCDGMALDADGNLVITGYKSGVLTRVTPTGEVLDAIAVPAEATTQVRYGGSDLRDVYLTCVPLDAGDGLAVGEAPTEQRSFLLRGRAERPGRAQGVAGFEL